LNEQLLTLTALRQVVQYYSGENIRAVKRVKLDQSTASLSYNKHFETPQPVSSTYTGREYFLKELKRMIIDESHGFPGGRQRRFVIHGMGGSGKTQLCSKCAEDNRESIHSPPISPLRDIFITDCHAVC
jgi:hypothetical protein